MSTEMPDVAGATARADAPPPPSDPPAAWLAYRTPIQDFVHSADGKSAGILALLGIMFTLLARFGERLNLMTGEHVAWAIVTAVLLFSFALLSLGAVVQAFRTISPRFPKAEPTLAFFGDIAQLSRAEYVRRVESLSPDEAMAQMLDFNHNGAAILVEKFRQLNRCLRLFELAAVAWLALMACVIGTAVF